MKRTASWLDGACPASVGALRAFRDLAACNWLRDLAVSSVLGASIAMPSFVLAQTPVADPNSYSRTVAFEYHADGRLKTQTVEPSSPQGQSCVKTTYAYDNYGNRKGSTIEHCTGAGTAAQFSTRTTDSGFDAQTGSDASLQAPAGTFAGRLTNAKGHEERREYDAATGVLRKLTGPNDLSTEWRLDAFGRVEQEIRADTTRTRYFYCYIAGRVTDASSNSTDCPVPGAAEIPADAVRYVYSELRNASDSKVGAFTRIYEDRLGRKLRQVKEAFDGPGQVGGSSRLIVQDWVYNRYGALEISTQPYFLDAASTSASGSGNYGMTKVVHDALGRPVDIYTSDFDGSQSSVNFGTRGSRRAALTHYTYNGLSTEIRNDQLGTRLEERGLDGAIVRVTDALGAQLAHQYDAFGQLIATKDALGNVIRISYDVSGRRLRLDDPDTGLTVYCYDALGQLKAQQTSVQGASQSSACPNDTGVGIQAKVVTGWATLAYDELGRMTERLEPNSKSTWSYDAYADASACNKGKGKLCEAKNTNGLSRKYSYDGLGRPVGMLNSVDGSALMASAVGYDALGRIASRTYPTGLRVNFNYTDKGYLQSVTLGTVLNLTPLPVTAGGATGAPVALAANSLIWEARSLNAQGLTELQTYGNDVNDRATFDAYSSRVRVLSAGKVNATDVLNHTYVWDSLGRMTSRVDDNGDLEPGAINGAISESFGHDALGRLKTYTVLAPAIPGGTGSRTVELKYNALGMLLNKSDVGIYSYVAAGGMRPHAVQILKEQSGDTSYQYDDNGNRTGSLQGGTLVSSIQYDSATNQPLTASANGATYAWLYDENRQRTKEVHSAGGVSRTTWMMHPDAAGGLGFEREVIGANTAGASNRHYISAGGATVAVIVSQGNLPVATGTQPADAAAVYAVKVEYWHRDHLGSLAATTDHQGAVTARYAYDPFGKRRFADGRYDENGAVVADWNGTSRGTDRGFTGHEHLDDIGIIHMNGRLYDPKLGRFVSADPYVATPYELQGYDRYAYVLNNPLANTDPTGFQTVEPSERGKQIAELEKSETVGSRCNICGPSWVTSLPPGTVLIFQDFSKGASLVFENVRQKVSVAGSNIVRRVNKLRYVGAVDGGSGVCSECESSDLRAFSEVTAIGDPTGNNPYANYAGAQVIGGAAALTVGVGGLLAVPAAETFVLRKLVSDVAAELSADPALVARYVTNRQLANARLAAANFGNAVERAVAERIASSRILNSMFEYTSVPFRRIPDFSSRFGVNVYDITTRGTTWANSHLSRGYGEYLKLIQYVRH